MYEGDDFAPGPVVDTAVEILSRNRRGYFLMVEWDVHTDNVRRGLDRMVVMDDLIRHVAGRVSPDTLLIFAADHSFDLRIVRGQRAAPMADQIAAAVATPPPERPVLLVNGSHSAEEIVATAQGPGAERLSGFIPNTRLFHVMMDAYGWKESP